MLHDLALATSGGETGVYPDRPVSGCVDGAFTDALYFRSADEEPDLLTYGAFLLRAVARGHCFVDGNKRSAWLSLGHILRAHSLDIVATDDEVVAFVEGVVDGTIDVEEMIDWLAVPGRLVALRANSTT